MANTSAVYARIDTELKENAERILLKLGISPSSAIQMFYSQIVLTSGLPLNLYLPSSAKPTAIGGMSRTELEEELTKGMKSLSSDKTYTADEVDEVLAKEFGL
jgi:addiction module RelB/DinJ family antitoxin